MTDAGRGAAPLLGSTGKLLLVLGAIPLAWLAVRAGIQSEYGGRNPALAMAAWPADGRSLAAASRQRIVSADGQVDAQARALYRSALARDPLLAEPVTMAGLDASADGDLEQAERLMLVARTRNPREPIARFWLLDHYMRTGRYAEGIREAGAAMRLRGEAREAVLNVLAALVEIPAGRAALRDELVKRPWWRQAFFVATTTFDPNPVNALALLQSLPRNPDRDAARQEQRAVLLSLVNKERYDTAYAAWREMVPATYRSRIAPVYDGNFAGWPGPAPFNWNLVQSNDGTAQMIRAADLVTSSALDVRYFGSNTTLIAEQVTVVPPGPWRLSMQARRRSSGPVGGRLGMEVRCARGMSVLASLPLENLAGELRTYATNFAVPADCPALRLRLTGVPGDVFSEVEAQITGVALSRPQ